MAACGVCKVPCSDATENIKCAGECGVFYHLVCVNQKFPETVKTRGSKKEWFCEHCKKTKTSSNSSSRVDESSTQLSKQFMINLLEAFKAEVVNELKSYGAQFTEFKASLEFFSAKFDEASKTMDLIKEQNNTILRENELLKRTNAELSRSIGALEIKVRDLEQYSRRENIEVSGIPVTARENEKEILRDLGRAIGVEMEESSVVAVHRVPAFNRARVPALIARFTTREMRDMWLQKFKARKSPLLASDIHSSFPKSKVYVGEHLTPDNKLLLRSLKEEGQRLGVRYVWCREGRFYARKAENYNSVRVNGLDELRKVCWEAQVRK